MNPKDFLNKTEVAAVPDFHKPESIDDPAKYLMPPALLNAAKVAIFLGQPLLLTGEAGTGKTQLATAVAHKFNLGEVLVFNTKTSSTAKDLLYAYDSLAHFQFAQNNSTTLSEAEVEKRFISYRALGNAIMDTENRNVVLIDEIDKAPRDLPNDILDVIDRMHFEVPEINRTGLNPIRGRKEKRPIIIMTSNSEKNLPDAFLRRCVFFHIKFPNDDVLIEILKNKVLEAEIPEPQWKILLTHFRDLRKKMNRKQPATAELINWVRILTHRNFDIEKLKNTKDLDPENKEILLESYSVLAKNKDDWEKIEL